METDKINGNDGNNYEKRPNYGLSSLGLKVMAVVTMFIDHFAIMFCQGNRLWYLVMRSIGRLSFPLFCFLLVEGFIHTKNRKKHAVRLAVFALISEVPYDMFHGLWVDFSRQNVMVGLFIGYMTIWILDFLLDHQRKHSKENDVSKSKFILASLGIVILGFAAAYVTKTVYSYGGILLIVGFYLFREKEWGKIFTNAIFNMGLYGIGIQWFGVMSCIPIDMYNGKPGKYKWKYFFYWFYPLHLLAFVVLKNAIG